MRPPARPRCGDRRHRTPPRLGAAPDGLSKRVTKHGLCRATFRQALLPVGFVFDADRVGDPVDVVEEGDDLDRVVDRGVAPALVTQFPNVLLPDRSRLAREAHGELTEHAYARLE